MTTQDHPAFRGAHLQTDDDVIYFFREYGKKQRNILLPNENVVCVL